MPPAGIVEMLEITEDEAKKIALEKAGISADKIDGISFCSQMQGVVLVDKDGLPVRWI